MRQTIYRIQDKNGRGPWKPGQSYKWVRRRPDASLQPWYVDWPKFQPMAEMTPGEVCGTGCQSLDQLRRWFNRDEYNTLRILGYRAVEITGARVLRANNRQVVFACPHGLNEGAKELDLYPD